MFYYIIDLSTKQLYNNSLKYAKIVGTITLSCTDDRQENQILLFVVKDFQTIHVTQRRIDGLLVGVYRGQTLFRTLHHTVYP